MTSLSFLAGHALAAALLAASAWAVGTVALERWAGPASAAFRLALGLAALGQVLQLLGLVRGLTPLPLALLGVGVLLAAAGLWRRQLASWRLWWRAPRTRGQQLSMLAAGSFAILLWLLSLYPPVAFDETLYHLPFTRAFAASGGLPFLPDLRVPIFPQLAEILAVPWYLAGGDVATHAIPWLATLATAGILLAWGRLIVDAPDPAVGTTAGELAAAFWLGSPVVVYLSGVGYVEPLLAMTAAAAAYAHCLAFRKGSARWLLTAGLLAGSAASIKYHGLFFVAALGVASLAARGQTGRARWRAGAVFGVGALAGMAVTYGRLLARTGSPLFPFYPELFGASPWSSGFEPASAFGRDWVGLATLPWRLLFERASAGGMPPHTPALLLALPAAAYAAWRWPAVRIPAGLALAYALLSPMDSRYLEPIVPLLALSAAVAVAPALASRRRVRALVVLALLLPGVAYALFGLGRNGVVPTTPELREHHLEQWLPLYPAVRFLNRREPEGYTAYGVLAEQMVYWANGRWLGDWNGTAAYGRVLPLLHRPGALHTALRARGVDYLVVRRGRSARLRSADDTAQFFHLVYVDPLAEIYAVRGAGPASLGEPAASTP